MKNSNSQKRIRELMDFYGLSQSELCRRTGIQKSALSNYLSGTREPRQDQISFIADPFNVNPAWLMGYDVPMYIEIEPVRESDAPAFTIEELQLLDLFRTLPDAKRSEVIQYCKFLASEAKREKKKDTASSKEA